MTDDFFKLENGNEEVMRVASDGKTFFPKDLKLSKAREAIDYMSERLYSIPSLYKNDHVNNLEEAKQIMKDLASKMVENMEFGGEL